MNDTQGDKPVSLRARIIGGSVVVAAVAALVTGVTVQAHAAQVTAEAHKALAAAVPAYQGAISLGGKLDDLTVKSAQAKEAYDVEQERLAAEKAAQEAAAARVASEAAAQAAADEAARQAATQQQEAATDDTPSDEPDPGSSGGSAKLPVGSPVPWIANPDPQDQAGGRWDTSACASGSASGNPAICD